jgi:hypothetical protein
MYGAGTSVDTCGGIPELLPCCVDDVSPPPPHATMKGMIANAIKVVNLFKILS